VTTAEKQGGWSPTENKYVKGIDWQHPIGPESDLNDKGNHPVVQISWYDAMEYSRWLNQKLRAETGDQEIRLPTEAEWEKAARGEYGNEWPWGNEFDANRCNSEEGGKDGTMPVDAYSPQGDSPYGTADMVGNVREWCHSLKSSYPYKTDDGREKESEAGTRVLRGGAWYDYRRYARCAYRYGALPGSRPHFIGFRVVIAPRLS
jgi:formylglycine-generating enzyme required for sulfatase activity